MPEIDSNEYDVAESPFISTPYEEEDRRRLEIAYVGRGYRTSESSIVDAYRLKRNDIARRELELLNGYKDQALTDRDLWQEVEDHPYHFRDAYDADGAQITDARALRATAAAKIDTLSMLMRLCPVSDSRIARKALDQLTC